MKKQNNLQLLIRYSILACAGVVILALFAFSYDFIPPQTEQIRHVAGALHS